MRCSLMREMLTGQPATMARAKNRVLLSRLDWQGSGGVREVAARQLSKN